MGFLNSKIISIFITVSLFLDSTVYGADVIDIRTLRIPLSGNRERITDIYKRAEQDLELFISPEEKAVTTEKAEESVGFIIQKEIEEGIDVREVEKANLNLIRSGRIGIGHSTDFPEYKEKLVSWIKARFGRGISILSVAAGRGDLELALQKAGNSVTALEYFEPFVNEMKAKGVKNVIQGDARLVMQDNRLMSKEQKFDLVIFSECLGTIGLNVIDKAVKFLKDNGVILVIDYKYKDESDAKTLRDLFPTNRIPAKLIKDKLMEFVSKDVIVDEKPFKDYPEGVIIFYARKIDVTKKIEPISSQFGMADIKSQLLDNQSQIEQKVPSRVNNILDRLKFNKTEKQLREWARSVAIEDLTQERDKIEELRSFYKRLLSNPAISEEVKNSIKRRDRIATAIIIFIEIMNKYSEISKENIQKIIEDTAIKDIDKKYRLELFEMLSESGERTDKPVISTIAHLKGTAHTTSNVLVFKKDGRSVLLQLRTPDKASFPSRWTLSWCGHAKWDIKKNRPQTPLEAAEDEADEVKVEGLSLEEKEGLEKELDSVIKRGIANISEKEGSYTLEFIPSKDKLLRIGAEYQHSGFYYMVEFMYLNEEEKLKLLEAKDTILSNAIPSTHVQDILSYINEDGNTLAIFTFNPEKIADVENIAETTEKETGISYGLFTHNIEKKTFYIYVLDEDEQKVIDKIVEFSKRKGKSIDGGEVSGFNWRELDAVVDDFRNNLDKYTDAFIPFLSEDKVIKEMGAKIKTEKVRNVSASRGLNSAI